MLTLTWICQIFNEKNLLREGSLEETVQGTLSQASFTQLCDIDVPTLYVFGMERKAGDHWQIPCR